MRVFSEGSCLTICLAVEAAIARVKPRAEQRYSLILDGWDWLAGELEAVRKRAHAKQLDGAVLREIDWYISCDIKHIGMSVAAFDVSSLPFESQPTMRSECLLAGLAWRCRDEKNQEAANPTCERTESRC